MLDHLLNQQLQHMTFMLLSAFLQVTCIYKVLDFNGLLYNYSAFPFSLVCRFYDLHQFWSHSNRDSGIDHYIMLVCNNNSN